MARSMSALAKPMLSMLAIAASRSPPMVRAEGSLNWVPAAACCAGAGEGVAGACWGAVEEAAGAGAAGVWAATGAGVEGGALLEDAAEGLGLETMQTMKPFSSMLYDSTVLASCRILPVAGCQQRGRKRAAAAGRGALTRVDELLLGDVPALFGVDLGLELANLSESASGLRRRVGGGVPSPKAQLR